MGTLPEEQGTDDPMEDALPCVVVRNNNGETYSCIVTNGDYALLFGALLKEAFYGPKAHLARHTCYPRSRAAKQSISRGN